MDTHPAPLKIGSLDDAMRAQTTTTGWTGHGGPRNGFWRHDLPVGALMDPEPGEFEELAEPEFSTPLSQSDASQSSKVDDWADPPDASPPASRAGRASHAGRASELLDDGAASVLGRAGRQPELLGADARGRGRGQGRLARMGVPLLRDFGSGLRRALRREQQMVLQLVRQHVGRAHHPPPRAGEESHRVPASRVAARRDDPRVLQLRLPQRLPAWLCARQDRLGRRASVPRVRRDGARAQEHGLGPRRVAAAHSRPPLPAMARQGSHRRRADAGTPAERVADQQARGAVEGAPRRQPRGSREARRRRRGEPGPHPVPGRLPLPERARRRWSSSRRITTRR